MTKVKTILYMEVRATLIFRKFKVALNPMYKSWNVLETVLRHLNAFWKCHNETPSPSVSF